jgi:hypothetical protein
MTGGRPYFGAAHAPSVTSQTSDWGRCHVRLGGRGQLDPHLALAYYNAGVILADSGTAVIEALQGRCRIASRS